MYFLVNLFFIDFHTLLKTISYKNLLLVGSNEKQVKPINYPGNISPVIAYFEQLRGDKSTLNEGRLKRQMTKNDRLTAVNLLKLLNLSNFLITAGGKNDK
jgi:hypothetical protein